MEDSPTAQTSPGPTEQDFQCSCCYELMVDPTTLNCGHSFCRLCLARWWKSSKNTTCPECRQPWQGFPSVNIILRKTIQSLFPAEIGQRRATILDSNSDYHRILDKFEAFGKRASRTRSADTTANQANIWLKLAGLLLSIVGFVMIVYRYEPHSSTSPEKNNSPIKDNILKWTPKNVSDWISSLGSWAEGGYGSRFLEAGIDGRALVTLTDHDLQAYPLDIDVSYHRRIILSKLRELSGGIDEDKIPRDFWDYKVLYPVDSIFYLVGLREFPRATMIYMFLFDYGTFFHPVMKYAYGPGKPSTSAGLTQDNTSSVDHLKFFAHVTLAPYYVIGNFAFAWLNLNPWVASVVIIYSFLMSLAEFVKLKWLLLGGWRQLPTIIATNTNQAILNGMFHMVLWRVMPGFICDIVFYWMLFLSPMAAWNSLKTAAVNAGGENQNLRILFSWVWRNARGPVINFHARHN